jgi:hypothetical protein
MLTLGVIKSLYVGVFLFFFINVEVIKILNYYKFLLEQYDKKLNLKNIIQFIKRKPVNLYPLYGTLLMVSNEILFGLMNLYTSQEQFNIFNFMFINYSIMNGIEYAFYKYHFKDWLNITFVNNIKLGLISPEKVKEETHYAQSIIDNIHKYPKTESGYQYLLKHIDKEELPQENNIEQEDSNLS